MRNRNRVVVTGMGVVAPNGIGLDPFWSSLLSGQSAIGPITLFDAAAFPSRIAGEVRDFKPELYLDPEVKARRLNRFTQFALIAAEMARKQAGLTREMLEKSGALSICIGVSMGGFERLEKNILHVHSKGPKGVRPTEADACLHLSAASSLSGMWAIPSRLLTVSNTCVGGLDAIAAGAAQIREGKSDIAVAGGSDAAIVPTVMAGLCAGGMVSHQNDSPSTASRPFDRHRDGGILSEGSGMVILENLSHAMARGARPILEIIGFGSAADPANEESGAGLASCIREALDNATIYTHGVDGLCAHGPSDPVLDRVETQAVKAVLGNHARRIPVFSIKGVTGNPMAAGGAHQIVTSGLIVQTGQIPPTANYQYPDPDCDLDIVHSHPRCNRLKHLLINAHGSGRTNSAMIVRAFDIS